MFIFHWFGIFATDYRNGFADGFALGLICFGLRYLIPYLWRIHWRRKFRGMVPDAATGCFVINGRYYCPLCAKFGHRSEMAAVPGHSECSRIGCTYKCRRHDQVYDGKIEWV